MTVVAGDFLPGATIIQGIKGTSASIAKGDVVQLDTANNVWKTAAAAANGLGPFGVCTLAAATADTSVSVAIKGRVYVTAGGIIQPVRYITTDSATAGRVLVYAQTAVGATYAQTEAQNARDQFNMIVGMYEGHEDEGTIKSVPTNSAATDVIRISLGISG